MKFGVWIDESIREPAIAVGGVFLNHENSQQIVSEWRAMKETMGLDKFAEVKWSFGREHPTRRKLEEAGRSTKELSEKAVKLISEQDFLTLVCSIMVDTRDMSRWKRLWSKASTVDFYCSGLEIILQRIAEEIVLCGSEQTVVVCDTPSLGKEEYHSGRIWRGSTAPFDSYKQWQETGVGSGPRNGINSNRPLAELNFQPSLLIGDATYHDILQISDIVVGLTLAWYKTVKDNENDSWVIQLYRLLSKRFRTQNGAFSDLFFGDGFVLWPKSEEMWKKLKGSLKEGSS